MQHTLNQNAAAQDEAKARLPNLFETAMEGSAVVLHAYDHKQLVTVEEFRTMKVADFAKLYTVSFPEFFLMCIQHADTVLTCAICATCSF